MIATPAQECVDDLLVQSLRPRLRWRPILGVLSVWLALLGLYCWATPAPPPPVALPRRPARAAAVPTVADAYSMPPGADWVAAMRAQLQPLQHLAVPMPRPRPEDWLAQHPEPGQSFGDYWRTYTVRPTPRRHTIVVQPLGQFTPAQQRILALTANYLERYFHLPVRMQPELPLDAIPLRAFRRHPQQGMLQIHTGTVMQEVLVPRLPADAAVYLAFTAVDLFPQDGWNFVFGEASFTQRVGVWSLARNGDPSQEAGGFRRCLLRTIKLATHELGHMFGMAHCTAHPCNMNGVNSLEESDQTPLDLCPDCLAKLSLLTATEPADLLSRMAEFCHLHGLDLPEQRLRRSLEALHPTAPGTAKTPG